MPEYTDLFPKSFKARDFRNAPEQFTIKGVEPRMMESKDGKVSAKLCIRFEETKRFWLAGPQEACPSIANAVGSTNTDDWIGAVIELFEDVTEFGGEPTDCVRARKPEGKTKPKKKRAARKASAATKPEGWPCKVGDNDLGDVLVQMKDGGEIYEIHPDDLEGVLDGSISLED